MITNAEKPIGAIYMLKKDLPEAKAGLLLSKVKRSRPGYFYHVLRKGEIPCKMENPNHIYSLYDGAENFSQNNSEGHKHLYDLTFDYKTVENSPEWFEEYNWKENFLKEIEELENKLKEMKSRFD